MTDIEELVKALKEAGIDTTNMSEEDIRKLASTINNIADNGKNYNDIVIKTTRTGANSNINNNLRKPVQSPINQPMINNNRQPSRPGPKGPGLENKNNLNDSNNNNNNKGMNYTDDNNPRDNKPNPSRNSQPRDNHRTVNPAVDNNGADNTISNTRQPQNKLGDLNSGLNSNPSGLEGSTGQSGLAGNQGMAANPVTPPLVPTASSAGKTGISPEIANKQMPTPPALQDNLNSPKAIDTFKDKAKDIFDPTKNPNLIKKPPVSPENGGSNSGGNAPAVPAKTPPAAPANETPEEPKNFVPVNREKLNEPKNGTANSNKRKRSQRSATKDAVANNKIDRAKRRLRQNGIDPEQGTKPHPHRRLPVIPPPINSDEGGEGEETSSNQGGPGGSGGSGGGSSLPRKPSALDRLRNRLKGGVKRNREVDDTYNDPKNMSGGIKDQAKKKLKNKIRLFIIRHLPVILMSAGMVLLILFLIFIIVVLFIAVLPGFIDGGSANANDASSNSGSQSACTYSASGNTGITELTNAKVELINCDAKPSSYKTLETIDLEKYVLGVALAEIGPDSPDEGIKAQIVAARNVALSRNKSMCPSDPDNCFYGYNKNTNTIKMRACENDQVYWDYEKDIYRQDRGAVSLYSPEVNSGSIWKHALSEERKQQVLALAEAVKGEVLLDSSGQPIIAGYKSTDQVNMLTEAKAGKSYKEILEKKYGVAPTSGGKCSIGNIDYNNYQLTTDNSTILHQPLSDFLSSNGSSIDEFNGLIQKNVQKAGSGTRAGVVAAAVTLIGELSNTFNVKVPYFWGGGHEETTNLAKPSWGSNSCHTYANNQNYNYCGLDCSGFVGWAIYNGGFRNVTTLANSYVNLGGAKHVDLGSSAVLQPADLLYNSGHVILIIGVDNNAGQYICAEAAGNSSGVIFSRHSFNGDGRYSGVDMSGFYDNSANKRG